MVIDCLLCGVLLISWARGFVLFVCFDVGVLVFGCLMVCVERIGVRLYCLFILICISYYFILMVVFGWVFSGFALGLLCGCLFVYLWLLFGIDTGFISVLFLLLFNYYF